MADFRRWIYALAVVALLAGFTVPASAQAPPFVCQTSVSVAPITRAEGYTELVGDIVLNCNGGTPTLAGNPVPQVNFTVFLNTNVTSKVTSPFQFQQNPNSFNPNFNEALMLIDEPNSLLRSPLPVNPILNCGNTAAPDFGPSGPGVCSIRATSAPTRTYDGTQNGYWTTDAGFTTCDGVDPDTTGPLVARPTANSYGCGRPNIFQGRQGTPQNASQFNAVSFLGVPLDPPGTTTNRTIRITNIRANSVGIGVSNTFLTNTILANIAVNGPTTLSIANPQVIVAYVNRGLTVDIPILFSSRGASRSALRNRLDFVQCQPENPDLHIASTATASPVFQIPQYNTGGQSANYFPAGSAIDQSPMMRFTEGFASSWKTKNIAQTIGNSTTAGNGAFQAANSVWTYFSTPPTGRRNNPSDLAQNVPGTVYNTESGFMWPVQANTPDGSGGPGTTNPPPGFGFQPVGSNGLALNSVYVSTAYPSGTGVSLAGSVTNGTRLSASLSNVPSGASVWVPPVLYIYRQGSNYALSTTPDPTVNIGLANGVTGVMVLASGATSTDGNGGTLQTTANLAVPVLAKITSLAVYEVLYSDPFSLEIVDVPFVVAYQSNPGQNLPTPGVTTTGTGGFAPFYSTSAAGLPQLLSGLNQPTGSLPIPRFVPGSGPKDLFLISKCACNLLFPYVVSAAGFDTGIAIANSSVDPGATFGFGAIPQPGTITFWYYGEMEGGGQVPGPQTSKNVPQGSVLTYVASSGSTQWGLDGRAKGLIGYVITQSQFQYCHAFAYISALGAGPLTPGTSEGYLGIVLDAPGLFRTNQIGENMAH